MFNNTSCGYTTIFYSLRYTKKAITMSLPIQKKTDNFDRLPFKVRFLVAIIIWLLNKLTDYLEPHSMAPYFCINSYSDIEDEDWDKALEEVAKEAAEPLKH